MHFPVMLDAFSRKVIDYSLSKSIDTNIVLVALQMTISDTHPEPS